MNKYDDIINLPHYEPKHHPRMSMMARAAQFAPFSALNGFHAAIEAATTTINSTVDLATDSTDDGYV